LSEIDLIVKSKKASKDVKASAKVMLKLLNKKNLDSQIKLNSGVCYNHMESVAIGGICSLCALDAKNRYNDEKKQIWVNRDDVKKFKTECIRHIAEDLPKLAKLLKAMFIMALSKRDFSGPKDKTLYKEHKAFRGLIAGNMKSHLKCFTHFHDDHTVARCNDFVDGYYSMSVLLKPEIELLKHMSVIKGYLKHLNMRRNRSLSASAGVSSVKKAKKIDHHSKILVGQGISQFYKNDWEVSYGPEHNPKISLYNLSYNSGLNKVGVKTLASLQIPSNYVQGLPYWLKKTKKVAKKAKKRKWCC